MNDSISEMAHTILNVDDNDDARTTLSWVLKSYGFEVWDAATGGEALDLVHRRPDLVLLDVILPDQNGLDVCRRIKSDAATAMIPVMMISGKAISSDDQVHGLAGGADAYLTKPVEPDLLIAHARSLIRIGRAEEALRISEARMRAIIENSFDALMLVGPKGAIQYASPSCSRIIGYTPDDLLDCNFFEMIHPENLPALRREFLRQVHSPDTTVTSTYRFRHKDGGWRWLEERRTNLLNDDKVGALVTNFHDITGQREAEERQSRLSRHVRLLLESTGEGIYGVDADGKCTFINKAGAEMLGYAPDEVIGQDIHDLFHHKPSARIQEEREQCALYSAFLWGEAIRVNDDVFWRKDGSPIPIEYSSNPVPEEGAHGAVVAFIDITERKQAESALRKSENQYRMLFERNPHPMFVYDPHTLAYLAVNDAAVEQYGYSREEFAAMTVDDISPRKDQPLSRDMTLHMGEGFERRGVWKNRKKDGAIIEVEVLAHHIPFGAGVACIVMALDITERRRLEEQLRQSQKMEAIGRLAGGIAHDFNNLLTVINGYGDLAFNILPPENKAHEFVAEMIKAGERAADLTRQLLAFSRKTVLSPKLLDLNAVIRDMERLLRRLISEDIDFAARLQAVEPRVSADPGHLQQVILNLAVNARDAMPKGGKLTIETKNADLDLEYVETRQGIQPGRYVRLSVSDTGSGMTPEVQAHLFEPFFTTKDVGKGTGLGLAAVHGIVKQSGGHIAVYSELDIGTTFTIYLPVVEPQAPVIQSLQPARIAPNGDETVLLVEDEDAVRSLTRHVLKGRGYTVLEASEGEEALRIASMHEGTIHILVTDVIMPGMGGREVADRLRALSDEIKVLYLSGYTEDAVVRHGILEDQVNFLHKPFTPLALALKVREVLDAP